MSRYEPGPARRPVRAIKRCESDVMNYLWIPLETVREVGTNKRQRKSAAKKEEEGHSVQGDDPRVMFSRRETLDGETGKHQEIIRRRRGEEKKADVSGGG